MSCRESAHCRTAPDPLEILLRKQPPHHFASFYDHMRFLIEDDSVQSFASLSTFNQTWEFQSKHLFTIFLQSLIPILTMFSMFKHYYTMLDRHIWTNSFFIPWFVSGPLVFFSIHQFRFFILLFWIVPDIFIDELQDLWKWNLFLWRTDSVRHWLNFMLLLFFLPWNSSDLCSGKFLSYVERCWHLTGLHWSEFGAASSRNRCTASLSPENKDCKFLHPDHNF